MQIFFFVRKKKFAACATKKKICNWRAQSKARDEKLRDEKMQIFESRFFLRQLRSLP